MAYVIPDQTAKTIAKFLYQGYISIFGASARLLNDRGANFMSSVIDEICKILSMKKLQTMPYHPQTNGLAERSHQTIMKMIGKVFLTTTIAFLLPVFSSVYTFCTVRP